MLTLGFTHICFEQLTLWGSVHLGDCCPLGRMVILSPPQEENFAPHLSLRWLQHPPHSPRQDCLTTSPPRSPLLLPGCGRLRADTRSLHPRHCTFLVIREIEFYIRHLSLRENTPTGDFIWFKNSFLVKEKRSKPCLEGAATTELGLFLAEKAASCLDAAAR